MGLQSGGVNTVGWQPALFRKNHIPEGFLSRAQRQVFFSAYHQWLSKVKKERRKMELGFDRAALDAASLLGNVRAQFPDILSPHQYQKQLHRLAKSIPSVSEAILATTENLRTALKEQQESAMRFFFFDLFVHILESSHSASPEVELRGVLDYYKGLFPAAFFSSIEMSVKKLKSGEEEQLLEEIGVTFARFEANEMSVTVPGLELSFYDRFRSGLQMMVRNPGKVLRAVVVGYLYLFSAMKIDQGAQKIVFSHGELVSTGHPLALNSPISAHFLARSAPLLAASAFVPKEFRTVSMIFSVLQGLLGGVAAAPPTITAPFPDVVGDVGVPLNISFRVPDVFSGDDVSISVSGLPPWMTMSLQPRSLGNFNTPGTANKVALHSSGETAFVADESGTIAVDIRNPSAMSALGSLPAPDTNYGVIVRGDTVFTANWGAGFDTSDWRNFSFPRLLKRQAVAGLIANIEEKGGDLYLSGNSAGVSIYNVNNVSNPVLRGSGIDTPGVAESLVLDGERLIVADGASSVRFYNSSTLSELGFYTTPAEARGVTYIDRVTFAATYSAGIYAIDSSTFQYIDHQDTPGLAFDVTRYGYNLAVSDGVSGGQVYSALNPANLTFLGNCPSSGEVRGIAHRRGLLYMAAGTGGLDVCDVGTYRFLGIPPSATLFQVSVTARNNEGEAVTDTFDVNIGNVPGPTTVSSTAGTTDQTSSNTATSSTASLGSGSSTMSSTISAAITVTVAATVAATTGLTDGVTASSTSSVEPAENLLWLGLALGGVAILACIAGWVAFLKIRNNEEESASLQSEELTGTTTLRKPVGRAAAIPDTKDNYQTADAALRADNNYQTVGAALRSDNNYQTVDAALRPDNNYQTLGVASPTGRELAEGGIYNNASAARQKRSQYDSPESKLDDGGNSSSPQYSSSGLSDGV